MYYKLLMWNLPTYMILQLFKNRPNMMHRCLTLSIRNDLGALYACIKELRRCEQEGKGLYAKCALTFKFTKEKDEELKKKYEELEVMVNQLQQHNQKIEDIQTKIGNTYDEISLIKINKERIAKRFSLLRENLSLKMTTFK